MHWFHLDYQANTILLIGWDKNPSEVMLYGMHEHVLFDVCEAVEDPKTSCFKLDWTNW